jgi:hypothetical protein
MAHIIVFSSPFQFTEKVVVGVIFYMCVWFESWPLYCLFKTFVSFFNVGKISPLLAAIYRRIAQCLVVYERLITFDELKKIGKETFVA